MNKMWYGSIDNRIMSVSKMPDPVVGMGVTELCYSDRNPYEVVAVKDNRHITVRLLDWKRTDANGMSECQEYEFFSNPENRTINLFRNNKGIWHERIGRKLGVNTFYVGHAERYYDFTF